MEESGLKRTLPIIIVLIVIALIIAAIVSVVQNIFSGDDEPTAQRTQDTGQQALLNTAEDRSVRMTVRGPIVSDEKFTSYTITATTTTRTMVTYNGYLARQVEAKEYPNNIPAYEQFVHALDKANVMLGDELTGDADDTRGVCATGRVYEFEVLRGSTTVKRLWASTCKGSPGSLQASTPQVQNLFHHQIPDYSVLVRKLGV